MDTPHEKFCTTLSALLGSPARRKHVFLERKFNGASSLSGPWEKPLSSSTTLCITAPSQPCMELSARWIEFPQVGTRTPHPNWKKGAKGRRGHQHKTEGFNMGWNRKVPENWLPFCLLVRRLTSFCSWGIVLAISVPWVTLN